MKKTLSASPRRIGANRLRPLMLAMCMAGCTTLTLAQLTPRVIDPLTLPDVHRTVGDIKTTTVVTESSAKLTITQTSSKGVVESQNLSVGSQAWVDIIAPNANSLTVLRAIGQDPSFIYGRITANDRLFLVNQNGIYIGKDARISASSLVMSALDIDPDYVADDYAKLFSDSHLVFTVNPAACGYGGPCDSSVIEIESGATLVAADGGGVMLIGNQGVRNSGDISTGSGGDITLLATAQAGVDIGDSGFIKLVSATDATVPDVNRDFTGRTVLNTGTLDAPNGTITLKTTGYGYGQNVFGDPTGLTSRISEGTLSGVFNTGTIKAQGVFDGKVQALEDRHGKVVMVAEGNGAVAVNSGKIDVSAADARSLAGSMSMSAESVMIGNLKGVAELLADGPNGGGEITINNATVTGSESSSLIHVLSGSVLSADATDKGNGGYIKLSTVDGLSDAQLEGNGTNYGELRAYGTLRARGGVNGGDGGVVETSGSYVNVNDAGWGKASIQVNARAAGGAGGVWSLYSPDITIGNLIPGSNSGVGQSNTYINADDINAVLDSGGSVGMATTYQGNANIASGNLTIESDTQILQSLGGGNNYLFLQSGNDLFVQSGTTISSTSGKLNVVLAADADGNGQGSLLLNGQIGTNFGPLVAGRARAQAQEGDAPVTINTNGGMVNLTGAKDPAISGGSPVNDNAGVVITGTVINTQGADGRGDVFIKGAGGVAGFSNSRDTTVASQNGVTINGGTDITAGNVNILGNSTSATGVSLSNTTISTDKGTIDIRGISQGGTAAPAMGQPIGVDIGSGVVLNAGQGYVKILGRGVREAVANAANLSATYGVRANDLTITTSGANAGQQIVIVGQSGGSTGAGIQVDSGAPGIRLYDQASPSIASTADVVIGASADAMAPQALNLGTFAPNTTGRRNFRPAGVDADGNVTESTTTAIRVGSAAGGVPTNFIINPAWLGSLAVIGSDIQAGLISVEAGALNGAGTITLQNQGAGSQGIDLGAQTGNNTGLTLNLVTTGDISQSGPLNVGQLQVIASPQSTVSLSDPGNQIARAIYDNSVLTPQINAQALPQANTTSGLLGYSVNVEAPQSNAFKPLSINYTYANNETRPYVLPPDRPRLPFESIDALNELRTDVYLHGQFSRPQLCTPANTSGAQLAGLIEVEPLTMEWTKVRRGAQLTNCSGVQADSNCSAF